MKIWDFEKIVFRLNVLATLVIFLLLTPTTKVFGNWYPENKDLLWLVPVMIAGTSGLLWFVMSLLLPLLIKWGVFEDRRRDAPREPLPARERLARILTPIAALTVHTLILVFCCLSLIRFMRGHAWEQLFVNLP